MEGNIHFWFAYHHQGGSPARSPTCLGFPEGPARTSAGEEPSSIRLSPPPFKKEKE